MKERWCSLYKGDFKDGEYHGFGKLMRRTRYKTEAEMVNRLKWEEELLFKIRKKEEEL